MTCQCEDAQFWEKIVSLLISIACEIEREKLNREHTTAELRKAGKRALCVDTNEER